MMSKQEKQKRIDDLKEILDRYYEKCDFNGITCYKNANGLIFDIDCFSIVENDPAYVAEYKDKDEYEDGSRYYISDYDSLEDLAKDIMNEINNEMPVC